MLTEKWGKRQYAGSLAGTFKLHCPVKVEAELSKPKVRACAEFGGGGGNKARRLRAGLGWLERGGPAVAEGGMLMVKHAGGEKRKV